MQKKNESRGAKSSMASPARERRPHVVEAVGEGEAKLLHQRRAGLLHVVAGDRDRVEAGHVPGCVGDDVGHDPHAGLGRVDVRVADHELLEDVVLDGARQLLRADALLFRRDDVGGQHRQHGAVHGHRHADLAERNAVKEALHVLHCVDGDARLAHVAAHSGVVAVVAPVGGEIEGDGEALLPGGEVPLVEGVALLGGGEARVLADRPRPVREHGGAHAPRVGGESRQARLVLQLLQVGRGVERLDRDAFRRLPREFCRVAAPELSRGKRLPVGDGLVGGIGHGAGFPVCGARSVTHPDSAMPCTPCVSAICPAILTL